MKVVFHRNNTLQKSSILLTWSWINISKLDYIENRMARSELPEVSTNFMPEQQSNAFVDMF